MCLEQFPTCRHVSTIARCQRQTQYQAHVRRHSVNFHLQTAARASDTLFAVFWRAGDVLVNLRRRAADAAYRCLDG